jgi:hypothetical protein
MSVLLALALSSSLQATPAEVELTPAVRAERRLSQQRLGRGLFTGGFIGLALTSVASGVNVGVAAWNGPYGVITGPMLGVVGAVPLLGPLVFLGFQERNPNPDRGFIMRSWALFAGQAVSTVVMLVGAVMDGSSRVPAVTVAPVDGGGVVWATMSF